MMNKKTHFLLLLLLTIALSPFAQSARTWVYFDGKGTPEEVAQAEYALSAKAILRLKNQKMLPGYFDLPVNGAFIQQLESAGLIVHTKSRWMNAVSVEGYHDLAFLQRICPAAKAVRPVRSFEGALEPTGMPSSTNASAKTSSVINYGNAQFQTEMMVLDQLHDLGFTGQGKLVAIFDAGFSNADTVSAYDSLWLAGRILTWYDFVDRDTLVFQEDFHGEAVFSLIGANLPGSFVGTAPHASFILARTEDVSSERHIEEDNWLEAVEWADSIGTDIITSSLGYSVFDPGEGDYTYADMDGNTTIITNAADLAAGRGILVVSSAGNEGAGPWHYITAPCDGDSVLCVGAVDFNRDHAGFSSYGPSVDGRVKPDVVTMGQGVSIVAPNGMVQTGSGTSFSGPQITGLAASLWSAHPLRRSMQVMEAIIRSADRYTVPDTAYGYGIPNAMKADSILSEMDSLALSVASVSKGITVYPNPFSQEIRIFWEDAPQMISFMGVDGRVILSEKPAKGAYGQVIQTTGLPAGLYFLKLTYADGSTAVQKMVCQP